VQLAPTLVHLFERAVTRRGDRPYLWRRTAEGYEPIGFQEIARRVRALARALRARGVQKGDRLVIVAENRPEWLIADMACLTLGAVTVPAYTTNTVRDHRYVIGHSRASAVVYSGATVARTLLPAIREEGGVRVVVAMEPPAEPGGLEVLAWDDLLAEGDALPDEPFDAVEPDDLACIIYTSGTGGQPKGVMLSHANILANCDGAIDLLEELGVGDDEVFLSFLPLSHSYEHTAGQFVPMAIGAQVYYAEGVDTLSQNLTEARPTILTCVPRLYEVMRQRILSGVNRAGGTKAWLFHKAVDLGTKRYEKKPLNPFEYVLDRICDRLVRSKVKERFGGRLKAMVSGGAPLNYDVGVFFAALGLPIFQGYGQTEAAPVISANRPKNHKLHTVGMPLKGVEVKIADDGEILVRGALVMKGYWQDDAATAATLIDGWLHTGDIGTIDADGFLLITGRKKEMIVNSGGDNISPQRVEGIMTMEPEIGQILVYGDRRPHLVALVVPDAEWLKGFAKEQDLPAEGLQGQPAVKAAIKAAVERANGHLSVIEKVRRYEVMGEAFTIENAMMTPTLKLRRPIIVERYKDLLEGLYDGKRAA
jgi:long-chain acyl-CoA synthetase